MRFVKSNRDGQDSKYIIAGLQRCVAGMRGIEARSISVFAMVVRSENRVSLDQVRTS